MAEKRTRKRLRKNSPPQQGEFPRVEKDVGYRERMFGKRLWERDGMIEQLPLLSKAVKPEMLNKIREYDLKIRELIRLHINDGCELTQEMKSWVPHDSTLLKELAIREEANPSGKFVTTREAKSAKSTS
ncbi:MAG: hypothetical protein IIA61_13405 [Candidatus Marinimicrobia bacterium]|nr:hypothetical protein [Candidatus Neomarinimicrobiota bacterium]